MEHNRNARDKLKAAVIEALARRDEVYQICLFGGEVAGTIDEYSDIDLIVCSCDPAKTHAQYRDVFASISPIRSVLLLESAVDEFAEMILLEGCSPYHKIDFSIVSSLESGKSWAAPFLMVYEDGRKGDPQNSTLPITPIKRTAAYVLHDMLFSVPRLTKCLFRRDTDMYRRWERCTRTMLNLLYEQRFGWHEETSETALTIPERKALFAVLTAEDRVKLSPVFPASGELNIAHSYQACMEFLIVLAKQKAERFEELIDLAFAEHMRQFLNDEIRRYFRR